MKPIETNITGILLLLAWLTLIFFIFSGCVALSKTELARIEIERRQSVLCTDLQEIERDFDRKIILPAFCQPGN